VFIEGKISPNKIGSSLIDNFTDTATTAELEKEIVLDMQDSRIVIYRYFVVFCHDKVPITQKIVINYFISE
jgi:hypothetical protein